MNDKELKKLKRFVLIAAFAVTAVFTYLSINYTLEMPTTTTMDSATLPTVMMRTENGTLFNELHGYITEIDASLLNDSITPLPDDKNLSIVVNTYGTKITKVSYKIRKLSDMSLIEDTAVSNYEVKDNAINTVLNIKNLIENDTEYLLDINIETEEHQKISYYTKIISSSNLGMQKKIDFVMNFNACTFDHNRLDEISGLLESKTASDNSNFGKVDLYSSKSQIGWGNLNPKIERAIIPTIKEINSELASIYLEYTIAAQGTTGSYDTYNVDEFYRVRQSGTTMYLLNFDRETNQIFDSTNDLTENKGICLGITSDEDLDMKCSSNGNYSCFVSQGALWSYYDKDKAFTRIFSFEAEDSDNVRELYNKHNVRIMDIDDAGNVNFIIYGYMNRGAHEGELGVSLCSYKSDTNQVEERLFIPINGTYDELQENVGSVAYISNNNVFYFLLGNSLYSIDLTSKEIMVEISGITDETYAVSDDGTSIAYSLNGKAYDTDAIRIFNMATGSDHQIKADEGDRLQVLGYIKNDCIIGTAHKSDIRVENNGSVTFPMYKLNILNSDFDSIKDYEIAGVYVSSASVSGMRINLNRVIKNAEGNYESTSIDQLMNREENNIDGGLSLETYASDIREKESYLKLVNAVTNASGVSTRTSKKVVFNSGEKVSLDAKIENSTRYFVYGYGKFRGSYTSLNKAISAAYDTYGIVFDSKANYVWRRYKETSGTIANTISGSVDVSQSLAQSVKILLSTAGMDVDAASKLAAGKTALDIINEATGNNALNLKGVTVENILYYINVKKPVIGRIGDNSYVLITSYDSKNMTYYDISTGKPVTMLLTEANKLFTQWGNVFITYR